MKNKKDEIEDLIKKLDLTPAMYRNAKEKYDNLRDFLKEKDVQSTSIYDEIMVSTYLIKSDNKNWLLSSLSSRYIKTAQRKQ